MPSIHPTPLLEKSRPGDATTVDGHAAWIDDYPTLLLPTMNIDQLPTQVGLEAIYKWPPAPFFTLDSLSISEQPTWTIPVIREAGRAPKHVAPDGEAKGYVSLLRDLVKSSGIYALSSLASPLISLVLAPFLTHTLAQADYGTLAVLNTIIALVAGVTQLGLNSAFLRTYNYDYESQRDRLDVLSTLVLMLFFISVPATIAAMATAPWLATVLLNSSSLSDPIRVAALVILVQNLSLPGLLWLHAENRATLFSIVSIVNLLVTAGANIVLVGALHMGIIGSLLAAGGGYGIVLVCTLPIILLRAGLRLRFDIAWQMLTFGFPHTINLVSGWVLQLSDRYLLSHYGTLSQTASYAVAYTLGGVLSSVIIAPFSLAWWVLMYSFAKRDDAHFIFQLVFRWFSIALLFSAFGLSLVGVIVLNVFFPLAYHSAAPIIPIIAASIMFNGIFVVVSVGLSLQRRTWLAAIFTTFSALLNVGLNIVLIPSYGSMGAAVATLVAYAVYAFLGYVANQRIYPVPFEIDLFIIALLVGIALYTGGYVLAQTQPTYVGWCIHIAFLVLYAGCLVLLGKQPAYKTSLHADSRGPKN